MRRGYQLGRQLAVGAAAAASIPAALSDRPKTYSSTRCEVRLWGPGGTRGRSAAAIAAEKAAATAPKELSLYDEVGEFVRQGPLFSKLACPPYEAEWLRLGAVLIAKLKGQHLKTGDMRPSLLDDQVARQVFHFYLPLYFWMKERVIDVRVARGARGEPEHAAVVFGISAPQGAGKTTTVKLLKELFADEGVSYQALSIDDFYLQNSLQEAVAELHESNALMQTRGNAGTHEVSLGERTLKGLRSAEQSEVPIPLYNKSAKDGQGDRVPSAAWDKASTPVDVVVIEGWMLGFKPRNDSGVLAQIHPGLPLVNEKLQQYQVWDDLIDAWCVVGTEDIQQVYSWRLQAEQEMKAKGRPGMSDGEVKKFVDNYMPAYAAYRQPLYSAANAGGVDGKPTVMLTVESDRTPRTC
eukprot:TRINITY_DN7513_c3_g1_i1.p1 TRINITY_DN7513_c3_g1~~TRINITY_DN7513_c3_g1_i1.p1  ORF type:complete len:409 (-),score=93.27 TRINITY_DN7513_c3_g1_i1:70-1296(-)